MLSREGQKWFTARGRFQRIFNSDSILSNAKSDKFASNESDKACPLWKAFLILTDKYRREYFELFTRKVNCCGSHEIDRQLDYRIADKWSKCDSSIDFLFSTEEARKQWTLDHHIEAFKIINHLKNKVVLFDNNFDSIDLKFYAHLLFSLEYNEQYGKPNLRPRCIDCDQTCRRENECLDKLYEKTTVT